MTEQYYQMKQREEEDRIKSFKLPTGAEVTEVNDLLREIEALHAFRKESKLIDLPELKRFWLKMADLDKAEDIYVIPPRNRIKGMEGLVKLDDILKDGRNHYMSIGSFYESHGYAGTDGHRDRWIVFRDGLIRVLKEILSEQQKVSEDSKATLGAKNPDLYAEFEKTLKSIKSKRNADTSFSGPDLSKEKETLIDILNKALDSANDLDLATNVAYWMSVLFHICSVPWNTIIHKIYDQGGRFPKIPTEVVFVTPDLVNESGFSQGVPPELRRSANIIYKIFEQHHFNIHGYVTIFYADIGRDGKLYYVLKEIRGIDFLIGYGSSVDHYYQYPFSYTGKFDRIAFTHLYVEYIHHDNKGPTTYEYAGNNWINDIKKLRSFLCIDHKDGHWKEDTISTRLKDVNRFPVSYIFKVGEYQQQARQNNKFAPQVHHKIAIMAKDFMESFISKIK